MRKIKVTLLALTVALTMGALRPETLPASAPPKAAPPFDGELSVLTYNIHGLPWPVAWDRAPQLARIADRLRVLREEGRNPHIVVLQEAFTGEAQSIGRASGYRYIANGPGSDAAGAALPTGIATTPATDRSWLKGEDVGKYVGSGLQILSDYPIIGVRGIAYPASACAGYDCLANKGAMMATVRLPGQRDPIDIVTTHLNSRGASKVSNDLSFRAYQAQVACLSDFIRQGHDPARALIVAGDFNVGRAADRRSTLVTAAEGRWTPAQDPTRDIYGTVRAAGMHLSPDAAYSFHRAKDWTFYAPGKATRIDLAKIDVPFGHAADGSMLSDHVGYTTVFRLSHRDDGRSNSESSRA